MNDATALVAYQIALAAAVTGTFSLWHASVELILTGVGGVAVDSPQVGVSGGFACIFLARAWSKTRYPS